MKVNWLFDYYPNSGFKFEDNKVVFFQPIQSLSIRQAIEMDIGNVTKGSSQAGGSALINGSVGGNNFKDALLKLVDDFLKKEKSGGNKNLEGNKYYLFYVKNKKNKGIGFFTNNLENLKRIKH